MCQRRWAFAYRADQRDAGGKAAEAGKRTHRLLELAKDTEPELVEPWEGYDITRMARELWKHNPKDEGAQFEVEFTKIIHGVLFKGVIDRLSLGFVLDYKTTGGSLKYAKSPAKLKKDVQRLLYSQAYPEVDSALWITGTWGNSEGALRAGDVVPYSSMASQLRRDETRDTEAFKLRVLAPAEEIAAVPAGADPMSFPMPENAFALYDSPCQKFPPEKCPHFATCHKGKNKSMSSALRVTAVPVPMETVNDPKYLIENLYVDCMPLFETETPITYGHDVIAKASREVEADVGLKHVLLADYGKGPHLLAAELCSQLELLAPVQHFYLETKGAHGRGVAQELMARSRHVYKGMF